MEGPILLTPTSELRMQLQRLKRKADQQTTAHGWLCDRYVRLQSTMTLVSLLSSVLLLAVAMATPEYVEKTLGIPGTYYQWLLSGLGRGFFRDNGGPACHAVRREGDDARTGGPALHK